MWCARWWWLCVCVVCGVVCGGSAHVVPDDARPALALRERVVELGRDLGHSRKAAPRDEWEVVVLVVVPCACATVRSGASFLPHVKPVPTVPRGSVLCVGGEDSVTCVDLRNPSPRGIAEETAEEDALVCVCLGEALTDVVADVVKRAVVRVRLDAGDDLEVLGQEVPGRRVEAAREERRHTEIHERVPAAEVHQRRVVTDLHRPVQDLRGARQRCQKAGRGCAARARGG